ncbi:hypothetical protein [Herpetosiphon giganteus]|uniref:hypothetical protein n=1 Tax=Herpetosiphon giganteus TaxID=2029754 RepID=UPI00195B0F8D|nr:hypothetical protein [Herpetosiphon giganteus]MBM7846279.1 hypothetical protein [Herpetosiphon giganteus]
MNTHNSGMQQTQVSVPIPIAGSSLPITLHHSAQMSVQVLELIVGTVVKGVFTIGKHVIDGINYLANEIIKSIKISWHRSRTETYIGMIEVTSQGFGAALSMLDANTSMPQIVKDATHKTLQDGMQAELARITKLFLN